MNNDKLMAAIKRGMKNAGWSSPTDDMLRQITTEVAVEIKKEEEAKCPIH